MFEKDDSFQALVLSILVHIALVLILTLFAKAPSPGNNAVEIEILDSKEKAKSFVTDLDQFKIEQKLKDQADYLSRLNKRVKEQMVARRKGQTMNAGGTPKPPGEQPKRQELDGFKPAPDASTGFSGSQSPTRNIVIGESAIGEYIPGVKEGAFSALNTDQFLYYSFFSRINEQVRNRWVSRVRAFSARQSPLNIRDLARIQRISEIDIQLDKQGRFLRGLVLRTSGYPELDETAVDAFRAAAPFQNPPVEMAEEDGLIHLYYSFVVNWTPYQFAGRE